jgi:hypothetical protein
MEPKTSMQVATCLFAIAALGGLVMAAIRLGGKRNPPPALALLHGLLGAAGLTLLAYAWATVGLPAMAQLATAALLAAALGGLVLNLNHHWKGLPLPVPFMLGHAALAVAGFALLVLAMLRQP